MKPKISIVIVNNHPGPSLGACLRGLKNITDPLEVMVVDPIGGIEAKRLLKQSGVRGSVFSVSSDTTWPVAANLGAKHASGEYLCFLDPRITLTADALYQMTEWLNRHPRTVVGPRVMKNYRAMTTARPFLTARDVLGAGNVGQAAWPDTWHSWLSWLIPSMHFAWLCRTTEHPAAIPVLQKSCLMMKIAVWREIGDWPEHLSEYGVESVWFRRALDLGICAWYLPIAIVNYSTNSIEPPKNIERHNQDRRWHARRWGWMVLGALVIILWFERRRRRYI